MHTNMINQFQKVSDRIFGVFYKTGVELNLLNWENLKDRSIKLVQQINEILHDTK